jgi:DNA mismatch repair protein MutL
VKAVNRIHLLGKHVSELIAAGEVVERPASVVKELLENAIDAGATAVTLEIKNGGVSFIRVADNGSGILREDVPTAFLRHATSKIGSAEDLAAIGTLGFRGEALASVAAVSKVTMMTRTRDELAGTLIRLEGGDVVEQADTGCPEGTTVIVRELFYNTPARMKFLKKDVTEASAVMAVAQRIALSHPEVSIKVIKDDREEMHTPGDNRLISAVHAVLGKEFAASLIPVEYEFEKIGITGYACKPAASRSNRSMQFFFINGRLVKSKTAVAALEAAYKNSIMTGRYPGCVLYIGISPSLVDVNVHPSKIEVRFSNEKQFFDSLYYAVRAAVAENDARPELKMPEPQAQKPPVETSAPAAEQLKFDARLEAAGTAAVGDSARVWYEPRQSPTQPESASFIKAQEDFQPQREEQPEPRETAEKDVSPLKVVGECFDTYIIAERPDELWLIDKHAAHERLLYEQLRRDRETSAQLLLTPVAVTLSQDEYGAVLENLPLLTEAGFDVSDFGGSTVLVRSAPLELSGKDVSDTLAEMAGCLLRHKKDIPPEKIDWLYLSVACRAAVKGGDKSREIESRELVKRISEIDIKYCPHGRPVAFILRKSELEKQFGRT